jgi:hypothetical protein
MPLYTDIFGRLDWLTKTVKRLCCAVDLTREELAAKEAENPCYLELVWRGAPQYTRAKDYSILFEPNSPGFIRFTGLVTIEGPTNTIQRLYGGGNVVISSGDLNQVSDLYSINDSCGAVTLVKNNGFASYGELTYANLPGLQDIPEPNIFDGCGNLQYVNLPNVVKIGENAYGTFNGCSELLQVNLPKLKIISLGAYSTFENCISLNNISLPSLTTIYGQYTFASCIALQNIHLPKCTVFNINNCGTSSSTFGSVAGITATLTVPASVMNCPYYSGNPTVDVYDLINTPGNTITVVTT